MAESNIINELSALMVGRIPVWCQQTPGVVSGGDELPPPFVGGVSLLNSPRTLIAMSNRYVNFQVRGLYVIKAADSAATYSLVLDGETISFDGFAAGVTSSAQLYDGLLAEAQGNATLEADGYVFTTRKNSLGESVGLSWVGPGSMVFTSATATGPVAEVEGYCEAESFGYRIWATALRGRGPNPPPGVQWFRVGPDVLDHTTAGLIRLDTAGLDKLHVQAIDLVPNSNAGASILPYWYVYVGPSSDEDISRG